MDLPLVSILITSYNRAAYIKAAIESALAQHYPNTEIIIVDNCSTDGTKSILENYVSEEKIRIFINDVNIGQFPNRNKAASLAKGKYLKYLDSDDLLYPHSVSIMVNALESYPDSALGISYEINDDLKHPFPFEITPSEAIRLHFEKGLLFPAPGSILYKKNIFDKFGGFEDLGLPSDNFLTLKVASQYKITALPRDLYWWRRHAGQEFNNMTEDVNVQLQYFIINKKILMGSSCPLFSKEATYFLTCNKIRLCRISLFYLVKGYFNNFKKIILFKDLSLKYYFFSLFPVKYFK
jgi:glycosyltransferase involved in cell wall biosynthesis